MVSPLELLSGPGKPLRQEPPDAKEFAGLQRSGLARLRDAANAGLSLEGRFDLAYNAAHALCLAAVRPKEVPLGGDGMVTVLPIVISYFRYCRIRWAWAPRSGACWRNATRCGTSVNTRAI